MRNFLMSVAVVVCVATASFGQTGEPILVTNDADINVSSINGLTPGGLYKFDSTFYPSAVVYISQSNPPTSQASVISRANNVTSFYISKTGWTSGGKFYLQVKSGAISSQVLQFAYASQDPGLYACNTQSPWRISVWEDKEKFGILNKNSPLWDCAGNQKAAEPGMYVIFEGEGFGASPSQPVVTASISGFDMPFKALTESVVTRRTLFSFEMPELPADGVKVLTVSVNGGTVLSSQVLYRNPKHRRGQVTSQ